MKLNTATLWLCAVSGVLCAGVTSASAQTSLTIDDAVARALASAPRVAESRARIEAAGATVDARAAQRRPTLNALSGVLRTNHVDEFGIPQPDGSVRVIFPDIPTNYRTRAEVTMPLFTSGRVDAQVASAGAEVRAAEADIRAVRADIELETVTAYWSLVTARARVGVLERARDRADASVADVQARVDAGLLPPNDLLSAQAQRARQRVALIQAANDAAVTEMQLARLVGVDPGERITPLTPLTPLAGGGPGAEPLLGASGSALATKAITQRPERLAITFRQEALRAGADAMRGATRPQVGVLGAVEPARPNSRFVPRADRWHTSWDVAVNVTWSIWDGGRSRADRAVSQAQVAALDARLAEFDAMVSVEVRQRQLDLSSTQAALGASAEAVAAATEARRVVGERFAAGVATSSDVIDSDVALLEAELERTRLEASLRIGEARLIRSLGGR